MSQLWELPAHDLAGRIRAGEVSSREVVTSHLDRIERVNPALNAITVVLAEQALAEADAADRAVREGTAGPLCGVPMTVKENVDVAGSATTQGIVLLREAIPQQDATHIAELRAAGAIPIGRTNMPEFGMRWHTVNGLRGTTRNPWSAGHTAGGSSGGDAAAVAAGLTPLGMGNDGAGSLRWPAQCCGVAALKPSLGRIGSAGGAQPAPFGFQLLAVHGPLAREVRDLRLAFEHMCRSQGSDPWYAPVPLDGPPLAKRVWLVTEGLGISPAIEDALTMAAAALTDAGYVVDRGEPPALRRAAEIFTQLMSDYGRVHEEQPPVDGLAAEEFVRFWAAFEPVWTRAAGRPAFDPMMERATIARAWHEWMSRAPLVLAPIRTQPAFPVGADLDPDWLAGFPDTLRMAVAVNLLGLPSVAVPTGEAGGLPQAVQLIGPRFREDLCLTAAAEIEARVHRAVPIDPR
jgi:amidase